MSTSWTLTRRPSSKSSLGVSKKSPSKSFVKRSCTTTKPTMKSSTSPMMLSIIPSSESWLLRWRTSWAIRLSRSKRNFSKMLMNGAKSQSRKSIKPTRRWTKPSWKSRLMSENWLTLASSSRTLPTKMTSFKRSLTRSTSTTACLMILATSMPMLISKHFGYKNSGHLKSVHN